MGKVGMDLQVQLLRPVEDAEALCRLGRGPPSAGFFWALIGEVWGQFRVNH